MPSKRKQSGIRMTEEDEARAARLRAAFKERLGVEISLSELFRLGMTSLEKHDLDGSSKPKKGRTP